MCLLPRDAYFKQKTVIPLEVAEGQIAGELIAPYPPGIPLVYPGERITGELLREILYCREQGICVHGPADPSLRSLRVIKTIAVGSDQRGFS